MADRVGQQFGDYRLTRFLGRGSFGDVYLGEHVHDNTLAAIKVLQARLTPEDLKEFINEVSTTFRLQHPNIVRLLDFGIGADDTPFLAMDYAPNGTLRQRMGRNPSIRRKRLVRCPTWRLSNCKASRAQPVINMHWGSLSTSGCAGNGPSTVLIGK